MYSKVVCWWQFCLHVERVSITVPHLWCATLHRGRLLWVYITYFLISQYPRSCISHLLRGVAGLDQVGVPAPCFVTMTTIPWMTHELNAQVWWRGSVPHVNVQVWLLKVMGIGWKKKVKFSKQTTGLGCEISTSWSGRHTRLAQPCLRQLCDPSEVRRFWLAGSWSLVGCTRTFIGWVLSFFFRRKLSRLQ